MGAKGEGEAALEWTVHPVRIQGRREVFEVRNQRGQVANNHQFESRETAIRKARVLNALCLHDPAGFYGRR